MLTKKQQAILDCINQYIARNGYAPSVREICELTGLKSTATVHGYLKRLKENGALKKDDNKNRAYAPSVSAKVSYTPVPVVGTITAGVPILAVENLEGYYPLPDNFVRGRELFMLTVKGDSMMGAGIFNRDQIIIQRQNYAANGQIIAALVGDEATVKRFYKENGGYRLQPENDAYAPILTDHVDIIGIVVGLFRQM